MTPDVHLAERAALLNALPTAIVVADPNGRIVGWNRAAEALYGRREQDVLGDDAIDVLFDPDDRDAARDLVSGVGAQQTWDGDFRVRRADGVLLVSSFRLTSLAHLAGWAWIATDHIDQGLAEQERSVLVQAERAARSTAEEALGLVESILTSAPVGIAVLDLDLRYVRVNEAYAELSRMPAEAHIGGRLGDVVPIQPDVAADLGRVLTTGRIILARNVELHDATGRPTGRHFSVSYFPVHTAGGAMVGVGLAGIEITEAKRAEAERLAVLRRVEAAQERLSILATASSVLTTTMELDELLDRLTKVLTPAVSDWSIIELVDEAGIIEHVAVSHRDRQSSTDLAAVLATTRVNVSGDDSIAFTLRTGQARLAPPGEMHGIVDRAAIECGRADLRGAFTFGPTLVVPIEARDRVLGVLVLADENSRTLDDDDLDLAVEVAHRAALAVANARAFQHEHQIAESLQRALLPATLPATPALDIAVRYVAATDGALVGGDWYDVLAFDDGTTGIAIGDVVGHDAAASASMGQLRSVLRAFALEEHDAPDATLARVDRVFDSLGVVCATCLFGVVDTHTSMFRWGNAGHPPPLLLRDGLTRFLDGVTGVMLGVVDGSAVEAGELQLREGDTLVLYTDGLVERRGESINDGLDRLAKVAAEVAVPDAEVLCSALLARLVPSGATRDDDVAILVARVRRPEEVATPGIHRLEFERTAESIALVRGFAAGVLRGAGWTDEVDTAVLLVSELATNAVKHGTEPCAVTVSLDERGAEFSVEDALPTDPQPRDARPHDESGRGLLLLRALADDWGVRRLPAGPGKAIWFRVTR